MPRYNQDPRSSTFFDESSAITHFQGLVPVERENGQIDFLVDMLHHKTLSAIRRIDNFSMVKYDGITHITTLSFQKYGTTSFWWAIMIYNGFIHPLEIEPGIIIKLPDRAALEANLMDTKQVYVPGSGSVTI